MKIADLYDAIYQKDDNFIKNNFNSVSDDDKASVYYFACSLGSLELVKWMLDNQKFEFDERLHGCTKEEYGFQGACHTEGKSVREYLIKERNLTLSDSVLHWMEENKLGRLIPNKQKKI